MSVVIRYIFFLFCLSFFIYYLIIILNRLFPFKFQKKIDAKNAKRKKSK